MLSGGRNAVLDMLRRAANAASPVERAIHQRESGPSTQPCPEPCPEPAEGPGRRVMAGGDVAKPAATSATQPLIPSIGPSNQSVMFCASRAKRVAVMLARRGCVVRAIAITPAAATITLKSTVACRDLGGEQICHAVCDGQDARTYAVLIDGVTVEWTVRKNLGELP